MKRVVQPEILDSLPEDHADAAANRRDLRLINRFMGNHRRVCRDLLPLLTTGDRILEIGAGTGELGLHLRRASAGNLPHYCGLDLWSRPDNWPPEWEWERQDILTFDRYRDYTVLVANLILHQFDDAQLRRLGETLAKSRIRLIVTNEPARRKLHQWQLQLLRPFGLHPVSRHDGHVSVAAGFRGRELPDLLGLTSPEWIVRCASGFFGWNRVCLLRAHADGKAAPVDRSHPVATSAK